MEAFQNISFQNLKIYTKPLKPVLASYCELGYELKGMREVRVRPDACSLPVFVFLPALVASKAVFCELQAGVAKMFIINFQVLKTTIYLKITTQEWLLNSTICTIFCCLTENGSLKILGFDPLTVEFDQWNLHFTMNLRF